MNKINQILNLKKELDKKLDDLNVLNNYNVLINDIQLLINKSKNLTENYNQLIDESNKLIESSNNLINSNNIIKNNKVSKLSEKKYWKNYFANLKSLITLIPSQENKEIKSKKYVKLVHHHHKYSEKNNNIIVNTETIKEFDDKLIIKYYKKENGLCTLQYIITYFRTNKYTIKVFTKSVNAKSQTNNPIRESRNNYNLTMYKSFTYHEFIDYIFRNKYPKFIIDYFCELK